MIYWPHEPPFRNYGHPFVINGVQEPPFWNYGAQEVPFMNLWTLKFKLIETPPYFNDLNTKITILTNFLQMCTILKNGPTPASLMYTMFTTISLIILQSKCVPTIESNSTIKKLIKGGSPGLVIMGRDSHSKG